MVGAAKLDGGVAVVAVEAVGAAALDALAVDDAAALGAAK